MNNIKRIVEEFYKEAQIRRRTPPGYTRPSPHANARIVQPRQQAQPAPVAAPLPQESYVPRVTDFEIPDDYDFEEGGTDMLPKVPTGPKPPKPAPAMPEGSYEDAFGIGLDQGALGDEQPISKPEWLALPRANNIRQRTRDDSPYEVEVNPEAAERFRREDAARQEAARPSGGEAYTTYQTDITDAHRRAEEKRKADEAAKKVEMEQATVQQLKERAESIIVEFERSKNNLTRIVKKKQKSRPSEAEQKARIQQGYRWVYVETPKTAFDEPEGLYVLVDSSDVNTVKSMIHKHYLLAGMLKSIKQFLFFKKDDTPAEPKKDVREYRWR